MRKFLFVILTFVFSVSSVAEAEIAATKGLKNLNQKTRLASLEKNPVQNFDENKISFSVLSDNDIKVYKELFKDQRRLRRDLVVKNLKNLEDNILYGHLVAERLLHPRTRAPYQDLKEWLDTYNDHFQAPTIYKLANSRKPKTETHNKPASKKTNIARYTDPNNSIAKPRNGAIKNDARRRDLISKLNKAFRKEHYITAESLLKSSASRKVLGDSTYTDYSIKLAKRLFYAENYKSSYRVAKKLADKVTPTPHEAIWYEGISAYKMGIYSTAARAFRRMADTVPPKSKYYPQASYWAGLSYKKAGQKSIAKVFFEQSAKNSHDFYGMIAKAELGKKLELSWSEPKITEEQKKTLLNNPKVRRVIALAEIGEHDLAQKELRAVYSDIPYGMDEALLKMSLELNLPWNALTLSHNLLERDKEVLSGLYPDIQEWKPNRAEVDYSLINAIIRQESAFSPSITSSAGAMGLMQIMPATAKDIRDRQGKRRLPKQYVYNPQINVKLGQYYIGYLLEQFNGNLIYSIAAYNAGPGNVKKWISGSKKEDPSPVEFIESIPFPETKNYVKKVMSNYWVYRSKFDQSLYTLYQTAEHRWPKDTYSLVFRLK